MHTTTHNPKGPRAFSLMEVLVALGIFAVGFTAVAAIFPVGIHLQRETMREVAATQTTHSAVASLRERGFLVKEVTTAEDPFTEAVRDWYGISETSNNAHKEWDDAPEYEVFPIPFTLAANWPLADRSSPPNTTEPLVYDEGGAAVLEPAESRRDVYWVPMAFDAKPGRGRIWMMYVWTLQRDANQDRREGRVYQKPPASPYVSYYANPFDHVSNLYNGAADFGGTDPTKPPLASRVPSIQKLPSPDIWGIDRVRAVPDERRFVFDNFRHGAEQRRVIEIGDYVLDEHGGSYKVVAAGEDGITVDAPLAIDPSETGDDRYAEALWFSPFGTATGIEVMPVQMEIEDDANGNDIRWIRPQ